MKNDNSFYSIHIAFGMEFTLLFQVTIVLVLLSCVVPSGNAVKTTTVQIANSHVTTTSSTSTTPKHNVVTNCTNSSCVSDSSNNDTIFQSFANNKGMLLRTLYVLIGLTSVVVLYFVVRAWRMRRRRSRSRKYGLITSRGSDMEMAPLDADDEDEDMTVFEMNGRTK